MPIFDMSQLCPQLFNNKECRYCCPVDKPTWIEIYYVDNLGFAFNSPGSQRVFFMVHFLVATIESRAAVG